MLMLLNEAVHESDRNAVLTAARSGILDALHEHGGLNDGLDERQLH